MGNLRELSEIVVICGTEFVVRHTYLCRNDAAFKKIGHTMSSDILNTFQQSIARIISPAFEAQTNSDKVEPPHLNKDPDRKDDADAKKAEHSGTI